MKRICLKIEYDGTNYCGWQKQPNEKTIQGEIEEAIERATGQKVEVFGSGRTDAGVHALDQTAHFDIEGPIPTEKLVSILNRQLPYDIVIKNAIEVANDFHSRFSIKRKTYLYKIKNSQTKDAFVANRVAYVKDKLNIKKMKEAGKLLIGKHDFRGFCSANTTSQTFDREIYSIKIINKKEDVFVEVCGNGFLYNMVRIIVGTLVDYSLGKITLNDIKEALEKGDRIKVGQTMPPQGLYLKETTY